MSERKKLDQVEILDEPKLVLHDDGSSTKVLAIVRADTAGEPAHIAAGVNTTIGQCVLLDEFSDKAVAYMPGTYVTGIVNGQAVTQRVIREKYWGGTPRPFYERRIRNAQKKVGSIVMSHLTD